jgi:hypothetical protein
VQAQAAGAMESINNHFSAVQAAVGANVMEYLAGILSSSNNNVMNAVAFKNLGSF